MDAAMETVLAEQRLSDAVYEIFTTELNSTLEQAEVASRDRQLLKQFKSSSGGAVLMFQGKAIMRHDHGEPIKAYLKATKMDFLLPPETPDPVKSLDILPSTLAAARANNLTAKAAIFTMVHGGKPKSEEAASLATVNALIAGDTLTEPTLDNQMDDDRTRRAARAADTAHANNPWANTPQNCDAHGRYSAAAVGRQAALVKISLTAASGVAAACGSKIGDTTAQRKAT